MVRDDDEKLQSLLGKLEAEKKTEKVEELIGALKAYLEDNGDARHRLCVGDDGKGVAARFRKIIIEISAEGDGTLLDIFVKFESGKVVNHETFPHGVDWEKQYVHPIINGNVALSTYRLKLQHASAPGVLLALANDDKIPQTD